MAGFRICGGEKIEGTLRVDTAKNAVLPILAASVLPQEDTVLTDCPRLGDVECMRGILRMLGCESCWEGDALRIDCEIVAQFGQPVFVLARNVQEHVKSCVESLTGLSVAQVNVNVSGIALPREGKK